MDDKYTIEKNIIINNENFKGRNIKLLINTRNEYNTSNIWMYSNMFNNPRTINYVKNTFVDNKSPPMLGETYLCELLDISNTEPFIVHENWIKKYNTC